MALKTLDWEALALVQVQLVQNATLVLPPGYCLALSLKLEATTWLPQGSLGGLIHQ